MKNFQQVKNTKSIPTEHQDQCDIFSWANYKRYEYSDLDLLNASIMGVKLTMGQLVKAKKAGMKRGYPDLFLPVARGSFHGLFIELKRLKGGKVSPEQKEWLWKLNEQGYHAIVCKGSKEACEEIEKYLKLS